MRTPIVLAALLLLATPLASARLPVGCDYGGPCVILTPPTDLSGPADCREVVTTVGDAVVCTVGNGKVGAAAYACQYCLPRVLADCHEGTDGWGCSGLSLVLA